MIDYSIRILYLMSASFNVTYCTVLVSLHACSMCSSTKLNITYNFIILSTVHRTNEVTVISILLHQKGWSSVELGVMI